MKEFKVKYNHEKAKKVLEKLGAKPAKEEILEDFYLVDDGKDIYKLARIDRQLKLMHLVNEDDGFKVEMAIDVDNGKELQELVELLDNSRQVMRKERKHYQWRNSIIVLDKIENLGEFVEIYPDSDQEKQNILDTLGISSKDLITESYHSLWLRQ